MKRDEAITLLREISSCCRNLSPDSVLLIKAQPGNQFSVGYQLHIGMALNGTTVKEIETIASKNCCAVHEEKGEGIIIYKPKTIQA